jgi:predicted nucleic acid-binding protein
VSVVVAPDFVTVLLDRGLIHHREAASWAGAVEEDLVTTPLALAIIDIRADERGAAAAVREDFARGAYTVRWWADALDESLAIARTQDVGLLDASLVALAGRLRTERIATFDTSFRSLTTPAGKPFVMLPEDA